MENSRTLSRTADHLREGWRTAGWENSRTLVLRSHRLTAASRLCSHRHSLPFLLPGQGAAAQTSGPAQPKKRLTKPQKRLKTEPSAAAAPAKAACPGVGEPEDEYCFICGDGGELVRIIILLTSLRQFKTCLYNTTVATTCLPHTGFVGAWAPATQCHAELRAS